MALFVCRVLYGVLCCLVLDVGTKRLVYNTGISSFRRDDIILLRVAGQLVVAHGEHMYVVCVCVCVCVCAYVCLCVFMHTHVLHMCMV